MNTQASTPDWHDWYARWEAQQNGHMPDREERFAVITAAVAALGVERPHVVDLGCGPGSLAHRILAAIPGARVTAIDMDPVLLAIGRNVFSDDAPRLRFLDADLRSPWQRELGRSVDAAVSTTALHWLRADALADLYQRLAAVVRPGGVFLNGDHLAFDRTAEPRITAVAQGVRDGRRTPPPANEPARPESWEEWWLAVEADPGLSAEVAEGHRRHHDHPDHDHQADFGFHRRALAEAGFAEIDTLWQKLSDRVLIAFR